MEEKEFLKEEITSDTIQEMTNGKGDEEDE